MHSNQLSSVSVCTKYLKLSVSSPWRWQWQHCFYLKDNEVKKHVEDARFFIQSILRMIWIKNWGCKCKRRWKPIVFLHSRKLKNKTKPPTLTANFLFCVLSFKRDRYIRAALPPYHSKFLLINTTFRLTTPIRYLIPYK